MFCTPTLEIFLNLISLIKVNPNTKIPPIICIKLILSLNIVIDTTTATNGSI